MEIPLADLRRIRLGGQEEEKEITAEETGSRVYLTTPRR